MRSHGNSLFFHCFCKNLWCGFCMVSSGIQPEIETYKLHYHESDLTARKEQCSGIRVNFVTVTAFLHSTRNPNLPIYPTTFYGYVHRHRSHFLNHFSHFIQGNLTTSKIFVSSMDTFLLLTPLEGPLWKQGRTDLLMLSLPFYLGVFLE